MKTVQSSLEERYIWQVERRLPESMRADVGEELRGTIADMVDARGESDDAVREALSELGDPRVLAEGYAPPRRYLIGPEVYEPYLHILKLILGIVVPLVLAIRLVVGLWNPGADVMETIIESFGHAFGVGIQIFFWLTIVFAFLDRMNAVPGNEKLGVGPSSWNVDDLPPVPTRRQITAVDSVVGIVLLIFAAVAIFWQEVRSVFTNTDGAIPLLHPDLWSGWIPAFMLLLALGIGMEVWKYQAGRWTMPVVVANALLDAATVGFVVLLIATQQWINPEFATAYEAVTGAPFAESVIGMLVIAGTLIIGVWDIVDSLIKHARSSQRTSGRG
ncbi:HAAS signaling domain-containing protein [Arthrobacter pigmenti]